MRLVKGGVAPRIFIRRVSSRVGKFLPVCGKTRFFHGKNRPGKISLANICQVEKIDF
jgi:hypothetical protein